MKMSRANHIKKLAVLNKVRADERIKPFAEQILNLYQVEKLGTKAIVKRLDGKVSSCRIRRFLVNEGVWMPGTILRHNCAVSRDQQLIKYAQELILRSYRKDNHTWERLTWSNHLEVIKWKANKAYHEKHKHDLNFMERQRERAKAHYRENKEQKLQRSKKWFQQNQSKLKEYRRKYYQGAGKKWKASEKGKAYIKAARSKPINKIKNNLRRRLRDIVKSQTSKLKEITGCSSEVLRAHLEMQFTRYMTWDNYGTYWHVDHIIPCASYDLTKRNEVLLCFNWQNLRPLTAKKNIAKSNKVTHPQQHLALRGFELLQK